MTCLNFAGTGSRLYVAFVITWYRAKSMQLSLIFWQHFWGQARSCLPCHLPYTLLVHCTYQIHCDFYKSIYQVGSQILEIRSNFTPCKSNGSELFMLFVSYPNLIAIVPPDITSFVGWKRAKQSRCKRWWWSEKKTIYRNLRVMLLYLNEGSSIQSTAI